MRISRIWAIALGMSVLTFGVAHRVNAGFLGDTVSVSLTVHTTGAVVQDVWINEPAVIGSGVELTGISVPSHGILFWSLDLDDQTISLTVDSFPYDTIYAGYLTLVISGLDAMPLTSAVISTVVNDFEFANSQLSISGDTLTLGIFPGIDNYQPGTSYTTTIILAVPEASSVVMMLLAGGVAGGLTWRRRRRAKA